MNSLTKSVCVRGFILAVTAFVFGFSPLGGAARAGCDDHVVLGGQAAQNEQKATGHLPGERKTCRGPQCSKQAPGLPAIPVDGPKWVIEKASLGLVSEGLEVNQKASYTRPGSDVSFPPGHPGSIFDPPRS